MNGPLIEGPASDHYDRALMDVSPRVDRYFRGFHRLTSVFREVVALNDDEDTAASRP